MRVLRVYHCNSRNRVISNPYIVKMKELYVGIDTVKNKGTRFNIGRFCRVYSAKGV